MGNSNNVMNWRNRTKIKLVEYKGGKCERCGFKSAIPAAYDFHHTDPDEKDFGISGKSWSYERLREEVDKCQLLCKNCHAEVHWELQQANRGERLKIKKRYLTERQCLFCNETFMPKHHRQRYCGLSCSKKKARKVLNRPSKEQLMADTAAMSFCAVGRKYGVSDNAIRKWLNGR